MKYYVKSNGRIYGPVDERKIASKVAEGFFSSECLVSTDRQVWTGRALTPHMTPEPIQPVEIDDRPSVVRRRIPRWLIVLVAVLLIVAIAVAVLVVDVLYMDGNLTSWIYN